LTFPEEATLGSTADISKAQTTKKFAVSEDERTLIASEGRPYYLRLFLPTEDFVTCLYCNYFVSFFPPDM